MNQPESPSNAIRWSTLYGTLYYFLGKTLVDTFGPEGEQALRQAIRDFGAYRAKYNRARHEALGLPVNLLTLHGYGDMPGDSLSSRDRIITHSYLRSTITRCTLHDTWKELGENIGRIYCEEVHHPLYCGYDPRVELEMPDYLTKGDDICTFIMTFDNAEEPMDIQIPDKERGAGRSLESAMVRLLGIMYEYLANAMLNHFGEKGLLALNQALRDYATHRGQKLRADHVERGIEITPTALIENGDVPHGDSMEMTHAWETPTKCTVTITRNELFEAFQEIEGDQTPIGHRYMAQVPSYLWRAYRGVGDVRIRKSHTLGDPVTVIEIDINRTTHAPNR
jgi:hypothetical protein